MTPFKVKMLIIGIVGFSVQDKENYGDKLAVNGPTQSAM